MYALRHPLWSLYKTCNQLKGKVFYSWIRPFCDSYKIWNPYVTFHDNHKDDIKTLYIIKETLTLYILSKGAI